MIWHDITWYHVISLSHIPECASSFSLQMYSAVASLYVWLNRYVYYPISFYSIIAVRCWKKGHEGAFSSLQHWRLWKKQLWRAVLILWEDLRIGFQHISTGIGGMSPVVNIPGLNHAFEITKSGMITRVFKRRPIDAQHVDVGDTRGMMCKFWRVGIFQTKAAARKVYYGLYMLILQTSLLELLKPCCVCCNSWVAPNIDDLLGCVPIPSCPKFWWTRSLLGSANSARHVNFGLRHWPSFGIWDFMCGSKDEKKSREDDLSVVNPCKSNALYKPLHPNPDVAPHLQTSWSSSSSTTCWLG